MQSPGWPNLGLDVIEDGQISLAEYNHASHGKGTAMILARQS